jgi:hypothetical protein
LRRPSGRTRRGESINDLETVRRRKDGSVVPVSIAAAPVRDGSGRFVGNLVAYTDITQRNAHEAEIHRLNAERCRSGGRTGGARGGERRAGARPSTSCASSPAASTRRCSPIADWAPPSSWWRRRPTSVGHLDHDDGIGGADPDTGSGLRGQADRVEALGGTLEVASSPGAGTSLRAEISARR